MRSKFKLNSVIFTMVVVDFFLNGALGTISPFFAVFVTNQIKGGSVMVVGFAAMAYWITRSVFQLPIARWLDKTDGELDEFWAFFSGYLVAAFIPIIYFFASEPWHIYFAQSLFGFAMAWAVPAWFVIFTKHLDKFRIGFEWSLYSVFSVGVATAIASALGGIMWDRFGFKFVFLLASAISFLGTFLILTIRKYIRQRKQELKRVVPEKTPK